MIKIVEAIVRDEIKADFDSEVIEEEDNLMNEYYLCISRYRWY